MALEIITKPSPICGDMKLRCRDPFSRPSTNCSASRRLRAGERVAPPAVVDLDINVSHKRSANPEAVLQKRATCPYQPRYSQRQRRIKSSGLVFIRKLSKKHSFDNLEVRKILGP